MLAITHTIIKMSLWHRKYDNRQATSLTLFPFVVGLTAHFLFFSPHTTTVHVNGKVFVNHQFSLPDEVSMPRYQLNHQLSTIIAIAYAVVLLWALACGKHFASKVLLMEWARVSLRDCVLISLLPCLTAHNS